MSVKLLTVISLLILCSSGVFAQQFELLTETEVRALSFVPEHISLASTNAPDVGLNIYSPRHSPLLETTGWFFYGLKFSSPMEQFTALKPFDVRAFAPLSASSFQRDLEKNYLLIQNPDALK